MEKNNKRDYKKERIEYVEKLLKKRKEKEVSDQDVVKGIFSLCFLGIWGVAIIVGIWGFIKIVNWVTTLGGI